MNPNRFESTYDFLLAQGFAVQDDQYVKGEVKIPVEETLKHTPMTFFEKMKRRGWIGEGGQPLATTAADRIYTGSIVFKDADGDPIGTVPVCPFNLELEREDGRILATWEPVGQDDPDFSIYELQASQCWNFDLAKTWFWLVSGTKGKSILSFDWEASLGCYARVRSRNCYGHVGAWSAVAPLPGAPLADPAEFVRQFLQAEAEKPPQLTQLPKLPFRLVDWGVIYQDDDASLMCMLTAVDRDGNESPNGSYVFIPENQDE